MNSLRNMISAWRQARQNGRTRRHCLVRLITLRTIGVLEVSAFGHTLRVWPSYRNRTGFPSFTVRFW